MTLVRSLGAAVLAALLPSIALACDYCMLYQGSAPIHANGLSVRIDTRYLLLGTRVDHGSVVDNPFDQRERYVTTQLSAVFPAFDEASVLISVPLTARTSTGNHALAAARGADLEPNASAFGLGDASALFRYRVVHEMGEVWSFMATAEAGVKLPTGSTNVHNDAGELADAHLQLGSGSFDPVVGASFFAATGDWGFTADALGIIPTVGAHSYQFGNILTAEATAVLHVFPETMQETSLFVGAGIGGEWHASERQDGIADENTGGSTLYVIPQARLDLDDWSVETNVQIPVSRDLNGVQLGQSFRVAGGVQYRF